MVSGLVLLLIVGGIAYVLMEQPADEIAAPAAPVEPSEDMPDQVPGAENATESTGPSYRVVQLPETTRRNIYDDLRAAARTSTEKPLLIPQGTGVRRSVEGMLDKTFEREISRYAAMHDVTVDDIQQIIAEGDAKDWDPTPRSNAVRDGERVDGKERSEG